jgi:3-hydroxyacyl-[acyl-carrier-protein] dehydratase
MSALRRGIEAAAIRESTSVGADTAARRYRFSADFVGFRGHFPSDAILPAVVQLEAVVALVQELAGTPLRLIAVPSAKFLVPVRPGEDLEVRYRHSSTAAGNRYEATLTVEDRTVSFFSLELAVEKDIT